MGGVLTKIMPARTAHEPVRVVADLDSLIAQPVGFRFKGRVFQIQPVTTRQFMQLADVLGEIQKVTDEQKAGKKIHDEEVYEMYHKYISVLCPEFTLDMLKSMTLVQVGAVMALIMKHATGMTDDVEKKKMSPEQLLA